MREDAGAVLFGGPTAISTTIRRISQVGKRSLRHETPLEDRDRMVSMPLKKETKVLEKLLVTSSGLLVALPAMVAAIEIADVCAPAVGQAV